MDLASRFTGLFRSLGATGRRAHDPDVAVWAGVAANRAWPADDAVGGAGWTDADARLACIGEAVERWQTHPLAADGLVEGRFDRWERDDPALDPTHFVRFHLAQHAQPGFGYEPLTASTSLAWVRCRDLCSGAPLWAPADLVHLDLRPGTIPRFGPTISSGWSAHATPEAALARGVLELVERDAVVGAWWGRYDVVEIANADALLGDEVLDRIRRPNLRWRWFQIHTPYAAAVTLATLEGSDREGWVFSTGSAARLDLPASLAKSTLEAVQGRHYVRYLLPRLPAYSVPTSFAEHAAYYSRHPARLASTCLAAAPSRVVEASSPLPLGAVVGKLPPAAYRVATPPGLVDRGFAVVRVIAPALQPLHGDHRLPFLGGPLWARPLSDWQRVPPHPFA